MRREHPVATLQDRDRAQATASRTWYQRSIVNPHLVWHVALLQRSRPNVSAAAFGNKTIGSAVLPVNSAIRPRAAGKMRAIRPAATDIRHQAIFEESMR